MCHDQVSLSQHQLLATLILAASTFFWSPSVCVATTISCRDLTVFPFTELCVATIIPCHDTISIVNQFDPWSQPPFHVATSFVVFCLHVSCDSKLLICLFSYRDMGIRSRQGHFLSYCNSYRDLKSMSRPSLPPILFQPYFLVTTVSTQFSFFF